MKRLFLLMALMPIVACCSKGQDSSEKDDSSSTVQVNDGWRYIDGLYFDKNGSICSDMKETENIVNEYDYDSQGRKVKWKMIFKDSGFSSTCIYSYSGKRVKRKEIIEYSSDYPDVELRGTKKVKEYWIEYY